MSKVFILLLLALVSIQTVSAQGEAGAKHYVNGIPTGEPYTKDALGGRSMFPNPYGAYKPNPEVDFSWQSKALTNKIDYSLTDHQNLLVLKMKSNYLSELLDLGEKGTLEQKQAVLKKYNDKLDKQLAFFAKENARSKPAGYEMNNPFFGGGMMGFGGFGVDNGAMPGVGLGYGDWGGYGGYGFAYTNYCAISTDGTLCTHPDGRVYKLDSSVNQIERFIHKDVAPSKDSPEKKPAEVSEQ